MKTFWISKSCSLNCFEYTICFSKQLCKAMKFPYFSSEFSCNATIRKRRIVVWCTCIYEQQQKSLGFAPERNISALFFCVFNWVKSVRASILSLPHGISLLCTVFTLMEGIKIQYQKYCTRCKLKWWSDPIIKSI